MNPVYRYPRELVQCFGLASLMLVGSVFANDGQPGYQRIDVFSAGAEAVQVSDAARIYVETQGALLRLHDLTGPDQLDAALSAGLPPDPEQASQIVKARIAAMGPGWNARLEQAFSGTVLVQQHGIEKVPAVAFDLGTPAARVIYGVATLEEALRLAQQDQEGQPWR